MASRALASIRKWWPHLPQVFSVFSRSFFQVISRQPSHFSHRPSVRTVCVESSPFGLFAPFDSRLNQDINVISCYTLTGQNRGADDRFSSSAFFSGTRYKAILVAWTSAV